MDGTAGTFLQGLQVVDALADDIQQAALDLVTSGNRDGTALGQDACTAFQSVGTVHGDAAHGVLADVLLDLQDKLTAIGTLYRQGGVDGGTLSALTLKRDVDDRSDNLGYFTIIFSHNAMIDFLLLCY